MIRWKGIPSKILSYLVVSTPLKNISQNGNLRQIGVNMKNTWNHDPVSHRTYGLISPGSKPSNSWRVHFCSCLNGFLWPGFCFVKCCAPSLNEFLNHVHVQFVQLGRFCLTVLVVKPNMKIYILEMEMLQSFHQQKQGYSWSHYPLFSGGSTAYSLRRGYWK